MENINVGDIKINDNLSILFSDNLLKEDIRNKLLNILYLFIDKTIDEDLIEMFTIDDYIITGSMANYNYNKNSDIDIHILINKKKYNKFNLLKKDIKIFNLTYSKLKIENYDVELYVQDTYEKHISSGTYSILNNKWVSKPVKGELNLNDDLITNKYDRIKEVINGSLGDLKSIKWVIDKLKKYRQCGLDDKGEFSNENLIYKLLRTNGYIDKLYNNLVKLETKEILK